MAGGEWAASTLENLPQRRAGNPRAEGRSSWRPNALNGLEVIAPVSSVLVKFDIFILPILDTSIFRIRFSGMGFRSIRLRFWRTRNFSIRKIGEFPFALIVAY